MVDGMKVLATIPARGGSKRLPGKNLAPLAGKPMLAYSIEAAFECETIDRVVVSTEDVSIARVAQDYRAEVIERPVELAADEENIGPACRHALVEAENRDKCRYDVHVLLQPTSPFRTSDHIHSGLKLLFEKDCDSVLSVSPFAEHPYWARVIRDGFVYPFLPDNISSSSQRKQELPSVYYPNGALYITYRSVLFETNEVLGSRIASLLMTIEESVDIDTEFDLLVAEVLMRRRLGLN